MVVLALSLPNTAGDDNIHNQPKYTPPMITLMGHVGTGKEHSSGFRSFEVTCSTYNVDDSSQPRQFAVRCFFDYSPRWKAYTIPRCGSLVHAIGAWVGRYALEGERGQFQPAILVTGGFKSLANGPATDGGTIADPATPSPKKAIPRFAPPGYSGLRPLPSSTPVTPSQCQPLPRPLAQGTPVMAELLGASLEISIDSGEESYQTLPKANSVDNDSTNDTPSFRDGVLGSAKVEEHATVSPSEGRVGSRKRRRRGN
jgi:hypothetical protein